MRGTEIRDRQALVAPTRKDRTPGMDGTGGISLPAVASERLIWSRYVSEVRRDGGSHCSADPTPIYSQPSHTSGL